LMRIHVLILCGVVATIVACGGRKPAPAAATPPTIVSSENVAVVDSGLVESGPPLSGSLEPVRAAQLRAQIGGTLDAVYVNEGSAVAAGAPVALIDTTAIAESVRSARAQLTSATLAADVARRNYERSQTLHTAGAIADRDLEVAHTQAVAAEAGAADAQSRLATSQQQFEQARIRAPFTGVVSERPANSGDVVQSGTLIATIVDPAELQLEASVPAEQVGAIKPDTKVEFAVSGYGDRRFTARIARINPTVDPTTRQVRLYVTVANGDRALVAGAFADGRVVLSSARSLTVPVAAIDSKVGLTAVKRLRNGVIEAVPVTLGVLDDLAGRVQVLSGLSLGDTVLIGGVLSTPAGTPVRVSGANR
ncbi:MAG: efflux RND transporter periplasmic adaptor subunit, partial [Gemmatimonadales bacterium]